MMGMGEAVARMAEENYGLVRFLANRFDNTEMDYDDIVSVGTLGLIKACETFDESKGIKFATYAARCITNEVLMELRKIRSRITVHKFGVVSLDKEVFDEGSKKQAHGMVTGSEPSCDDIAQDNCTKSLLHQAVSLLDDRLQLVVQLRFGLNGHNEHSQKEVAKIIGVSQSYVTRLERQALASLKTTMQEMEEA